MSGASGRARQLVAAHEETAKTLVAQAQSALADEHVDGALRAVLGLHAEVVPALDRLAASELASRGEDAAAGLSTVLGLVALWDELADIDAEREGIVELILRRAARADAPAGTDEPALSLALSDEQLAAQAGWLREVLRGRGLPRSRWWWRLLRRARGGTTDRARITVRRGPLTVFEREPPAEAPAEPGGGPEDLTTHLGRFRAGDQLTLQFQVPLPGHLVVLHAVGDAYAAELDVLLPQTDDEAVTRRQHEVVEVVGELSSAPVAPGSPGSTDSTSSPDSTATEHSLIVLWAPEVMPSRFALDVVERRRVPPEARLWRYVYSVEPAAGEGAPERAR
ncbi:MAG: hypothetical protein U1A78_16420 [Polyangia bacterium]